MYSAVGSQFFSQLHKAFVLSLQVMAVNPGITFCEPGWIAGEVTLQHRNTVIVGEPAEFGKNRTLRFSGHP